MTLPSCIGTQPILVPDTSQKISKGLELSGCNSSLPLGLKLSVASMCGKPSHMIYKLYPFLEQFSHRFCDPGEVWNESVIIPHQT
jgi:hypothetical protein